MGYFFNFNQILAQLNTFPVKPVSKSENKRLISPSQNSNIFKLL